MATELNIGASMHPNTTKPEDYKAITDASRNAIKVCGPCRDMGDYMTFGKHWKAHWDKKHPN